MLGIAVVASAYTNHISPFSCGYYLKWNSRAHQCINGNIISAIAYIHKGIIQGINIGIYFATHIAGLEKECWG